MERVHSLLSGHCRRRLSLRHRVVSHEFLKAWFREDNRSTQRLRTRVDARRTVRTCGFVCATTSHSYRISWREFGADDDASDGQRRESLELHREVRCADGLTRCALNVGTGWYGVPAVLRQFELNLTLATEAPPAHDTSAAVAAATRIRHPRDFGAVGRRAWPSPMRRIRRIRSPETASQPLRTAVLLRRAGRERSQCAVHQ